MSFEMDVERIYSKNTKKYTEEVISSYENKNYRAAVVTLYITFITDLCEKLSELSSIYADEKAKNILNEIDQMGVNDVNRETTLIKKIQESKPELLDHEALITFNYLKSCRNICAHPSLDVDRMYPLAEPSRELVAGLIKSSIDNLFAKSAYLGKKIFDKLLDDLSAKKLILVSDEALESYFKQQYYNRFDSSTREYIFDNLFKMIFVVGNDEAEENREFNYKILLIMIKLDSTTFIDVIKKSKHFKKLNIENSLCVHLFMNFLARYPHLYNKLTTHIKSVIELASKKETNLVLHYINFYVKTDNLQDHLKMLQTELYEYDYNMRENFYISIEEIQFLKELCIEANCLHDLYILGINLYSSSSSFNEADRNFSRWIEPFISQYNENLIEILNNSVFEKSQCCNRGRASLDHQLIVQKYDELGGTNNIETLRK
ncbi:hypothetical protein ABW756_002867 [Listeria innocua]|uniref:hypothetical protein n=1 Tax=Listeria innocua TaxID=1642 RepID=UPI0010DE082D|nr:hypothetical protein [Listeria innocua]EAE2472793.1 hypothetical protein [Listeria innocua]EDO1143580.1 hypothetical protein [Listeria innocua]EDO1146276.1 hypothetical protein [Listeria innocua]EKM1328285.1 hypothetical protein [Listeria innocua]EKM1462257.1 hypothetical protein [Listeria innocua]